MVDALFYVELVLLTTTLRLALWRTGTAPSAAGHTCATTAAATGLIFSNGPDPCSLKRQSAAATTSVHRATWDTSTAAAATRSLTLRDSSILCTFRGRSAAATRAISELGAAVNPLGIATVARTTLATSISTASRSTTAASTAKSTYTSALAATATGRIGTILNITGGCSTAAAGTFAHWGRRKAQ